MLLWLLCYIELLRRHVLSYPLELDAQGDAPPVLKTPRKVSLGTQVCMLNAALIACNIRPRFSCKAILAHCPAHMHKHGV
jgi:hypothetical protein